MTIYYIYIHTSPSGKSYIGQTNNLARRKVYHLQDNSGCLAFSKALKKYGWDAFSHTILACCASIDDANAVEHLLITEYNTMSPYGYNLTAGGGSFGKRSDETRARMSAAQKGRTISAEHRRKLSECNKGKTISVETKQKIAAIKRDPEYMARWKASRAANRKLKQYIVTDPAGHQHVVQFMNEFCQQHNLRSSAMQAVARGLHTHHKGWRCKEITQPSSP